MEKVLSSLHVCVGKRTGFGDRICMPNPFPRRSRIRSPGLLYLLYVTVFYSPSPRLLCIYFFLSLALHSPPLPPLFTDIYTLELPSGSSIGNALFRFFFFLPRARIKVHRRASMMIFWIICGLLVERVSLARSSFSICARGGGDRSRETGHALFIARRATARCFPDVTR